MTRLLTNKEKKEQYHHLELIKSSMARLQELTKLQAGFYPSDIQFIDIKTGQGAS